MKVIFNSIIPFKGFKAVNLFTLLFVRKEYKEKMKTKDYVHESIHSLQMKELFYVPFYIIYFLEWFIRIFISKNLHEAYRSISFEKEAYANETNIAYLASRRHYAMWRKNKVH